MTGPGHCREGAQAGGAASMPARGWIPRGEAGPHSQHVLGECGTQMLTPMCGVMKEGFMEVWEQHGGPPGTLNPLPSSRSKIPNLSELQNPSLSNLLDA